MRSFILVGLLAAGTLHAGSIYQCSFNAGTYVTAGCYSTTAFVNTNDTLDWGGQDGHALPNGSGGGFGSAISNSFTVGANNATPWNTGSSNGLGVNLGIMPTDFTGAPTFDRVDNLGLIADQHGNYYAASSLSGLNSFASHFDGQPDATSQYSNQADYTGIQMGGTLLAGYQGDHLVRLDSSASGILITFSQPVYAVGLRVSSISNSQGVAVNGTPVQDLKIQAYNITNPTNTTQPFLSYELQDSAGFGTCSSITTLDPITGLPTPCNDAPYIGIDARASLFTTAPLQSLPNNPWISSIYITSQDSAGFLLDGMFIQDANAAPEPGMPVLIGSGLLVIGGVARRRYKSRT